VERRTPRALSSPRFRRRLAGGAVLVSIAAAVAVVSVLFWNTAEQPPSRFSNEPAQIFRAPPTVEFAPAERRELIAVAARFLNTAVKREHAETAYDLVSSSMRGGTTRREWLDGEIPVVPYPVDSARWKFDYSFADEVGLQVLVFPETTSDFRPMVFNMTLLAVSDGAERRWLIDSWTPKSGASAQSRSEGSPFQIALPKGGERVSAKLGAGWLIFPVLLLFTGALVLPLGILVLGRQRSRRAQRAYDASRR
jgi:hypothetical protein